MPSRFLAFVVGAAALLAFPLVAACGGSSAPAQAFDPNNANSVAHAALIAPADVAGSWSATRNDQFTDSANSTAIAPTAACKASDTAFGKATNSRAVGRAGRAEVLLSGATPPAPTAPASPSPGPSPGTTPAAAAPAPESVAPTIEETVEVYEDQSVPTVAFPLIREAMASNDVQQCRADAVKSQFATNFPDVTVVATSFAPSDQTVAATRDGFAAAFTLAITSGQGTLQLNFQTYGWRSGNAIVTLSFFGPPDQLTAGLVTATVQKAQGKLAAAK